MELRRNGRKAADAEHRGHADRRGPGDADRPVGPGLVCDPGDGVVPILGGAPRIVVEHHELALGVSGAPDVLGDQVVLRRAPKEMGRRTNSGIAICKECWNGTLGSLRPRPGQGALHLLHCVPALRVTGPQTTGFCALRA